LPFREPEKLRLAAIIKVIGLSSRVTLAVVALLHSVGRSKLVGDRLPHGRLLRLFHADRAAFRCFFSNGSRCAFTANLPAFLVLMHALALVCTATADAPCRLLHSHWRRTFPQEYWPEFRSSFEFVIITLLIGLSITSYQTLRYKLQATTLELRTRQVEQERAYKLLAEARLSSLESRIHPHFLFNTLNSIAALIPSNPQLAEDTVGKLASLLRFSLNANQSGLAPLSQELKIVRDYLRSKRRASAPRLRYEIAIPEALQTRKCRRWRCNRWWKMRSSMWSRSAARAQRFTSMPVRKNPAASCSKSATTDPASRSMPSRPNTAWAISSRALIFSSAAQANWK
jgi:hypothetical protein